MVDTQTFKKIQQLSKEIEESEGWKIEKKTRNLGISYYIFMSNYNQLKVALEAFNNKEIKSKIWAVENRAKLDQFQIEITRLFHNFLASAKSLVEHTRIIVHELYKSKMFFGEYKIEVNDQFGVSPLSHFVQDLRNYVLHEGIPILVAELTFNKSESISSILIDISSLKGWDGWSKNGRKYLEDANGNIKLHDIITAYGSLVIAFYNWFLRRQEELHIEEIKQLQKLKDEYNAIIPKFPGSVGKSASF